MQTQPIQIPEAYEILLTRVEKPGRYVGGEMNAIAKDPASVRATIALAFPDVYDIGMSYHGFRLLYERINARADFAAERVFTPWPDFAGELRRAGLPLTTLETYRPLAEVDILGFTLQHELCYTNVLEMLDLAGLPLRSSERLGALPLVVAGGEGAYSPEPMADFIDAFVLGDGEEIVFELLECVANAKEEGLERPALLRRLAAIPGVYVPSLYAVRYRPDSTIASVEPIDAAAPAEVAPRVYDISKDFGAVRPVVPLIRTVQDRTVVEVRRGCLGGCRFCQAGMLTRPARERPSAQVHEIVRQSLENTGDDTISLLSLSTADYTEIGPLARALNAEFGARRVSLSLPSLRINAFDVALAAEISSVRKSGFTFAPEAGSERLRAVINKPLDEADFLETIRAVLRAGWKTLKMYFMLGLPTETDADLGGIVRIVEGALACARDEGVRGLRLNVTLSPFVPKAHTPFQWAGQISREEIRRRVALVRHAISNKAVSIKTSPYESTVLEGVMARGDRRLGRAIEEAWRAGCRFDAWSETFRPDLWWKAMDACGLDPAWYAERERADDEALPYDHLLSGPGKRYLAAQRDAARRGETTADCVDGPCSGCAACARPKEHVLARDAAPELRAEAPPRANVAKPRPKQPPEPLMRLRLRLTKRGPLRFVSHLDLAALVHRLMRRCEAPLAHSHGFNPQPRIMLAPPLPLGFEGRGEPVDVLLLERIDAGVLLSRLRSITSVGGLDWIGVEEVPLKAPSIQQAIERYDYEIEWTRWGDEPPTLPLERDALKDAMARFMASDSWPIRLLRKGKEQERDARAFVLESRCPPPRSEGKSLLRLAIRSENGVTLSPLAILEAIFSGPPDRGVLLRVAREAIVV